MNIVYLIIAIFLLFGSVCLVGLSFGLIATSYKLFSSYEYEKEEWKKTSLGWFFTGVALIALVILGQVLGMNFLA
jgi:hypothetical protein